MEQTAKHAKEMMIIGLKNAHGLEQQATEMLKRNVQRLENYPDLKQRIAAHLEETKSQQERVAKALDELGESPSSLKDSVMGMAENAQMMAHATGSDEVLKNSYTGYAFEHFEIASYKALEIMARNAGEPKIEQLAREILQEEEAMADWLEQNLPQVVEKHLELMNTGDQKR